MTDHLYLVQQVVTQLAGRYPRHVDRSELWSAGAYGLVDASRRFDPRRGHPVPEVRVQPHPRRHHRLDADTGPGDASARRDIRTVRDVHDGFEVRAGRGRARRPAADLRRRAAHAPGGADVNVS